MKHSIQLLFLSLFLSAFCGAQDDSLPTIAVADFTSEVSTELRHGLPEEITERLVNSGRFQVYERDKLHAIMNEQEFQQSGFSDPQSAVSIGRIMGVRYILTGNILDFGKEVRNFTGYGVRSKTTIYRLSANMRVIDIESGKVLFSKNGTSEEMSTQSNGLGTSDETVDTRLAKKLATDLMRTLMAHHAFQGVQQEKNKEVEIEISSSPEFADVEIDGVFMGNAGSKFKVTEGLHTIKVSLPGYEEWDKKVLVKEGLSFKATLPRKVDTRIEVDVDKTETITEE